VRHRKAVRIASPSFGGEFTQPIGAFLYDLPREVIEVPCFEHILLHMLGRSNLQVLFLAIVPTIQSIEVLLNSFPFLSFWN
jgi:hypothetical protein